MALGHCSLRKGGLACLLAQPKLSAHLVATVIVFIEALDFEAGVAPPGQLRHLNKRPLTPPPLAPAKSCSTSVRWRREGRSPAPCST